MKFFSEIKNRVNEAPHYPEDPDEWNAMFGARKKKPQGDPEDQDFERFSAQQDADADDEISQQRQAKHATFARKRTVGYVDHEGVAPNGQRYNKMYVINAQDMQTANHEEYLFDKHHYGAKKVVDVKKEQNKNSVMATLYIVDNHKYGTWKPWKDAETKESKVTEGNDDNPVLGAIIHRIMVGRTDLLAKYGPQRIMAAAEDVADFVGDVEEIGSSDVSGWVKQVENSLKDAPTTESAAQGLAEDWDSIPDQYKNDIEAFKSLQHSSKAAVLAKAHIIKVNGSDVVTKGEKWDNYWKRYETVDIKTPFDQVDFDALYKKAKHDYAVLHSDRDDELNIGAGGRRDLQRQADELAEMKRVTLRNERLHDEEVAFQRAETIQQRKDEMKKIADKYNHELRVINTEHSNNMQSIRTGNNHEINKMSMEYKHEKEMWDKNNPQQEVPVNKDDDEDYVRPQQSGNKFDQDTGAPIKPGGSQQSDQWHTSQQVGYTPGRPGPDVTDVEPKPNKPFALGNDTKKESMEGGRAVDSKGWTQRDWIDAVKRKFPNSKIVQSKMIDGPVQVTLPNGKKLYWEPTAQPVAEGGNPEYDDEAGMAKSNLRTMARAVNGLLDTIGDNENLPEWAQEKIAKAEMMTTGVWDYLLSQEEQGIDPKVDEASLAAMRDYFSRPDGNTVAVDTEYGAPERKQRANVPPEIQTLIDKMYRVGKITPQEFDILKRFQTKTGMKVGIKEKDMGTGNQGYNNMLAVMKAVDAGQDATFDLGGEPITLEYTEARFLAGKYKAFLKAGRQAEFLQYMSSPVAFDRLMLQLRDLIDKQKNFKGSVPGERGVEEDARTFAPLSKDQYLAQKKALQDIQLDPQTAKDPELRKELMRRTGALRKQAIASGLIRVEEDAPAMAKMAGGLGLGLVAAAGAPAIVGILGPLLGIPLAAYGAYNAAKMGMAGVEKLWDMATDKLGSSDKVEQYATAQIAKLPPEKAQAATAVVKQVSESRKTVESTGPAKMISRIGKDMDESAPPNFPIDIEKKLLAQYKNDTSRAYATMWNMHNKQKPKTESLKALPAVNENEYWCGNSRMAKPIPTGYKKLSNGYLTRK